MAWLDSHGLAFLRLCPVLFFFLVVDLEAFFHHKLWFKTWLKITFGDRHPRGCKT